MIIFFFFNFQVPFADNIDRSWCNWTPRKHILFFALFKIFLFIHSHRRATFIRIYLRKYIKIRPRGTLLYMNSALFENMLEPVPL